MLFEPFCSEGVLANGERFAFDVSARSSSSMRNEATSTASSLPVSAKTYRSHEHVGFATPSPGQSRAAPVRLLRQWHWTVRVARFTPKECITRILIRHDERQIPLLRNILRLVVHGFAPRWLGGFWDSDGGNGPHCPSPLLKGNFIWRGSLHRRLALTILLVSLNSAVLSSRLFMFFNWKGIS